MSATSAIWREIGARPDTLPGVVIGTAQVIRKEIEGEDGARGRATVIPVKRSRSVFCFRSGSAPLSLARRRMLTERRNYVRVPAILLMGLVLPSCVSSREPSSQPLPPANLGSIQAAPPVPLPPPGGSSTRIYPTHHIQGWQVYPAGRLIRAGGMRPIEPYQYR